MTNNKKYYPWIVVALLWGVALLNYMDRQMLSTMKSAMMIDITELESATNFGRLMAVFLWIYGLMSPVAGMIADRINRKWLIVGSLFVWSFVTLMMGYSTDFNQIYILRAIMGVSEALYIPAGLSLITDYHQEKKDHTVAKLDSEPGPKESPVKAAIKGMGMLFVNISFWIILLYFATSSLPGWATKNWLPTLFSENLSIDMSEAGPLSTFTIAISSFIGVIAGGILSDKWIQRNVRGRIYTGSIGLALTIPALLLLGFGDSFAMIVGGGLCFGIGFGIFDANNMPILCQFVSPRYRATAYGIMNMTGVFAGAIITKLLGESTDAGNLGHDFAMMASLVFVALVVEVIFLRPRTVNMTDK